MASSGKFLRACMSSSNGNFTKSSWQYFNNAKPTLNTILTPYTDKKTNIRNDTKFLETRKRLFENFLRCWFWLPRLETHPRFVEPNEKETNTKRRLWTIDLHTYSDWSFLEWNVLLVLALAPLPTVQTVTDIAVQEEALATFSQIKYILNH